MAMLFDFYGDVLTDRQKEFYDLYYNEDLSLAEIAENAGISRQGVRDVIVRAEAAILGLDKYFVEIAGAKRGTDDCSKEAVLRRLVKADSNLLVVGDGKVEIALGREAGAVTLGIASQDAPGCTLTECNAQKYARLEKAGAHAITADFTELEDILAWL